MTPELQEEIARAIAKAERYAYFPWDEHYDGIALAIAPIIARLVAAEREAAAKAGWIACRKNVYALAEHTADSYTAADFTATQGEAGKQAAYSRGRCVEAKSIARALMALGPDNCDELVVAIRARGATQP